MGIHRAGRVAGVEHVIVNYGDFKYAKDEGFLALAYAPEGEEPRIIQRVKLGDSLADTVHAAWVDRGASAEVAEKVADK